MVVLAILNPDATALQLIDLLYLGLDDRAAFDAFTENLAVSSGATAVALSLEFDSEKPRTPTSTYGFVPGFLKKFEQYYHSINVHMSHGTHLLVPGAVLSTEQTCEERLLLRSEYYNDFLRPQKLFQACGAIVHLGPRQTAMLSLYPPRYSNLFAETSPLIVALVPHLQRVNRMAAQMGAAQAGIKALNRFNAGVLVVSASRKILLMNTAAERIVDCSDGLYCCRGVIRANNPQQEAELRFAIRSACTARPLSENANHHAVISLSISRRSDSRPYQITVERFDGKPSGLIESSAILFISDPDAAPEPTILSVTSAFGLTHAEARLAILLMKDYTLLEASAAMSITKNTARAHLRHIADKLGVRRQSEIVSVLWRSFGHFRSGD